MKKAFTLIELLISLIIIVIIIASLAPIITKKMSKPIKVASETKIINPKGEIFIPFDGLSGKKGDYFECEEAQGNILTCTIKNIPSPFINAVLVGGGGGGGRNGKMYADSTTSKDTRNYGKTFKIPTLAISNVKVSLYGGIGGGGGGFYSIIDENQNNDYIDSCPNIATEITVGTGRKYCLTKYNVRPTNYSDYHINDTNSTKYAESSAAKMEIKIPSNSGINFDTTSDKAAILSNELPACWIAPSSNCVNAWNTSYPTCQRTVCNYWAAEAMCASLSKLSGITCKNSEGKTEECKWRLATYDELTDEDNGIFYSLSTNAGMYTNPLQFCRYHSPYSNAISSDSPACGNVLATNGTPVYSPSITYAKYPYAVYLREITSQFSFTTTRLSDGSQANSVRCVLEKSQVITKKLYRSGGGAGAGAAVENLEVPQDIIDDCNQNNKDCNLVITTSYPPQERSSCFRNEKNLPIENIKAEKGADGEDGTPTTAEIIDKDGKILWGYKAGGGKGGYGATYYSPGKESEEGLCYKHDGTKWSEGFDCETETKGKGYKGAKGEAGKAKDFKDGDEFEPIPGGNGGKPQYNCTIDYSSRQGQTGGGFNKEDDTWCFSYGGSIGAAKVTYTQKSIPGAGGGGGGGAYMEIRNVFIPNKTVFEVQIGGGGATGTGFGSSGQGKAGGDTQIIVQNNIYYKAPGGKGGDYGYYPYKQGAGGLGGTIQDKTLNSGTAYTANGQDGTEGKRNKDALFKTESSIGGTGGRSGISVAKGITQYAYGCGGFFVDLNLGCNNPNNPNALNPSFLSSKNPGFDFKNGYYGSYGAGGGGGGWKYDEATRKEEVGNGAAGQGGYVYIWW